MIPTRTHRATFVSSGAQINVTNIFLSGIVGGLAMLALAWPASYLAGNGPWGLFHAIGALALGPAAADASGFDLGTVLVAFTVHMTLAVAFAFVLAVVIRRMAVLPATVLGGLWGAILYLVNLHLMTDYYPWFTFERSLGMAAAHLFYGFATALAFEALGREFEISRGLPVPV